VAVTVAPPTLMMVMVAIVLNGRTGVDRGGGFTHGRYRRGNGGRDGSQQDGATAENSANKNSSQLVHKHFLQGFLHVPLQRNVLTISGETWPIR
jgi:hypothetical protein